MSGDSWVQLEERARALVASDSPCQHWGEFLALFEGVAIPTLRRQWLRLQPRANQDDLEDTARDLMLRAAEKLHRDDYKVLRSADALTGARESATLRSFLVTVLARLAIDHQRTHSQYRRPSRAAAVADDDIVSKRWIELLERHSSVQGQRPPVTRRQQALQLLGFLELQAARATAVFEKSVAGLTGRKRNHAAQCAYRSLATELGVDDWTVARHLVERGSLYRKAIELEMRDCTQAEIAKEIGLSRRQTERLLENARTLMRARFLAAAS